MCLLLLLGFYIPPTAKVIRRQGLDLKSDPKDWRSPGLKPQSLVYKASIPGHVPLHYRGFMYMQKVKLPSEQVSNAITSIMSLTFDR